MKRKIVVALIFWKFFIIYFVNLALTFIPIGDFFTFPDIRFRMRNPYLIWVFANFDGQHYLEIARRGYQQFEQPFFPLYPLLINILAKLLGRYVISGLIISHLSLFIALVIAMKLIQLDDHSELKVTLLAVILTFPTSFYYGTAYNDSLFFVFAMLTLWYGRNRSFLKASIFGGLATLTRLNGLALFFYLLIEFYDQNNAWTTFKTVKNYLSFFSVRKLQKRLLALFIIPLSFVGYLAYVQISQESFSKVFTSMKVWHQDKITFPLQVVWRYMKIILFHFKPHELTYYIALSEFFFVALYCAALWWSWKKIRLSYWVFFALSILIPSLKGTFQGMPRYGLHLYPFFLCMALYLNRCTKTVKMVYFVIAATVLFVFVMFYTRGYFIA
jgi:hypothetical protein